MNSEYKRVLEDIVSDVIGAPCLEWLKTYHETIEYLVKNEGLLEEDAKDIVHKVQQDYKDIFDTYIANDKNIYKTADECLEGFTQEEVIDFVDKSIAMAALADNGVRIILIPKGGDDESL